MLPNFTGEKSGIWFDPRPFFTDSDVELTKMMCHLITLYLLYVSFRGQDPINIDELKYTWKTRLWVLVSKLD